MEKLTDVGVCLVSSNLILLADLQYLFNGTMHSYCPEQTFSYFALLKLHLQNGFHDFTTCNHFLKLFVLMHHQNHPSGLRFPQLVLECKCTSLLFHIRYEFF